MADQIDQGVRISTSPNKSETVMTPRKLFPLSVKFFFFILSGLAALSLLMFFVPIFQTREDLSFTLIILGIWSLYLLIVVQVLFVHPLHKLLKWFKASRDAHFEHVSASPVQSSDEIGHVAQAMNAAISMVWQAGEHEHELLQHKSDTITLIEHQLRTALTQLRWSLESTQVPPEVTGAVARISGTVQDIINAARIGEGRFGYVFAEVNVPPIVEKLVESVRARADSRGVQISLEQGTDIPNVLADADRLSIALSNILSNAIEYTPSGGTVTVSISQADEFVDITIKDTGIGMSQEDLSALFSKMHRGKVAMKMRPDGSGLGLYVAKNIFNEHGAEVMVKSEEGKGTQFSIRIHKVLSAHK